MSGLDLTGATAKIALAAIVAKLFQGVMAKASYDSLVECMNKDGYLQMVTEALAHSNDLGTKWVYAYIVVEVIAPSLHIVGRGASIKETAVNLSLTSCLDGNFPGQFANCAIQLFKSRNDYINKTGTDKWRALEAAVKHRISKAKKFIHAKLSKDAAVFLLILCRSRMPTARPAELTSGTKKKQNRGNPSGGKRQKKV